MDAVGCEVIGAPCGVLPRVDWREYLLAQFGALHQCAREDAEEQIDFAFCLYAPLACGDEFLQMLYARLHLISYLVAKYASKVDFYQSRTTDIGHYRRDAKSQATDQTRSVSQSSRRSDSLARSQEDSTARHETETRSADYALSRSRSQQETESDDVGRGETRSDSRGSSREESSAREDGTSFSISNTSYGDWNVDCSISQSYDSSRSNAFLFYATTHSLSGASEYLRNQASRFRRESENSRSRSDYSALATGSSEDASTSLSWFNAQADARSYTASSSINEARGETDVTMTQRDQGRGWGISESRARAQGSGQMTARSRSDAESDSEGRSSSQHIVTAQDLSDIAKHLLMMHEHAERALNEYVKSRNQMLFAQDYIRRYVEPMGCVIWRPYTVREDNLLFDGGGGWIGESVYRSSQPLYLHR